MKLLPEDATTKFGVDFIQRIFREISLDHIHKAEAKKALMKLSSLQKQARVISQWLDGDELAGLFLSGRGTNRVADLASLGGVQAIKSTDIAKEYFTLLLYALKEAGQPTMLLCVDEVEYLFSQMRGARIGNVINTLREIYDLPTSPDVKKLKLDIANIVFFYGISQAGWGNLNNYERKELTEGGPVQPFFSRQQRVIELGPLSMNEAEELIRRRLSFNRLTKKYEDPLIPYTTDFVEYVYQLTLGNPREIVERCDYALEDGMEERVPRLTRAFAKRVFESHGLPIEPNTSSNGAKSPKKTPRKRAAGKR